MRFPRRQLLRTLSFAFGSSFILGRDQLGLAEQTGTQPMPSPPAAGTVAGNGAATGAEIEKVTGIGGLFFRAHDPKALRIWYQQHLGISPTPTSAGERPWEQEAGSTAFTPLPETTKYFDTQKVWMVNFRVRDLDKMAAQLRAAGIEITVDPQTYPNVGRFAHLHDPEGNPIELWQPAQKNAPR